MALSEDQKQRNKVANRLRDQAYKARRDAFNATLERARTHPDVLRLKQEAELVSDTISTEVEKVLDAEKVLREQISKLEGQLKELHDSLGAPLIQDLRARRDALNAQHRQALREQEARARSEFPDMFNLYSVTGWTPPPDVQAQMDAIKAGKAS